MLFARQEKIDSTGHAQPQWRIGFLQFDTYLIPDPPPQFLDTAQGNVLNRTYELSLWEGIQDNRGALSALNHPDVDLININVKLQSLKMRDLGDGHRLELSSHIGPDST